MKIPKDTTDLKHFNIRMPKDIWMFLKTTAATNEVSMTEIVVACIEKYKKSFESRLTDKDINV